jgi:hypothetical protein
VKGLVTVRGERLGLTLAYLDDEVEVCCAPGAGQHEVEGGQGEVDELQLDASVDAVEE